MKKFKNYDGGNFEVSRNNSNLNLVPTKMIKGSQGVYPGLATETTVETIASWFGQKQWNEFVRREVNALLQSTWKDTENVDKFVSVLISDEMGGGRERGLNWAEKTFKRLMKDYQELVLELTSKNTIPVDKLSKQDQQRLQAAKTVAKEAQEIFKLKALELASEDF